MRSEVGSETFIQLFLALNGGALSCLSHVGGWLQLPYPRFTSSRMPYLAGIIMSVTPILPEGETMLIIASLELSVMPFSPAFEEDTSKFLGSIGS